MAQKSPDGPVFTIPVNFKDPIRNKLFSLLKGPLESLTALKKYNQYYKEIHRGEEELDADKFTKRVFEFLNISYEISSRDLLHIPKEGPCLVVANHPFGGIEGMILAALLRAVRHDVKIMANYFLSRIPELADLFIKVDPYGKKSSRENNVNSMRETIRFLRDGGMVGMFPAGDVSSLKFPKARVYDPPWNNQMARFVRITKAPVLPVYFRGTNSFLFHLLALIHPRLKSLRLPHELLNKRNKKIDIKVANPISYKNLEKFKSDKEMVKYLWHRVYVLKNHFAGAKERSKRDLKYKSRVLKPISEALKLDLLEMEIQKLSLENKLIQQNEFLVLFGTMDDIPNLLHEIGRLREITFRWVGEGTGKEIDLDHFDTYYTHLFIWNSTKSEVVGAYRLGLTDKILEHFGLDGLYTSSLFKYKTRFFDVVSPGVELGRSFVRKEYQKDYAPLMLLWKGIGRFIVRNPQYKYLFGPVSINDDYTSVSRLIITKFLRSRHFNAELAELVKARLPLKNPILRRGYYPKSLSSFIEDIDEVSKLVSEVESDSKGVPILLKQYLRLNGEIVGFNIDPDFSDVLDALILVDLTKTSSKILERYMGKDGATSFLANHERNLEKVV